MALKADFAAPAHASDIDVRCSGWRVSRRCDPAGASSNDGCGPPGGNGSERSSSAWWRPARTCWSGPSAIPIWARCIAVGLGGRQAGLGRSAAFRLLPSTDVEADELIDSSEGVATELTGCAARPLDREALRELILRFALLLEEVPEVVEADLNPVRCTTTGCVVLDMRLRIEQQRPVERVKTW